MDSFLFSYASWSIFGLKIKILNFDTSGVFRKKWVMKIFVDICLGVILFLVVCHFLVFRFFLKSTYRMEIFYGGIIKFQTLFGVCLLSLIYVCDKQ